MRGVLVVFSLVFVISIPFAFPQAALKPEEELNCKEAALKLQFIDAYECYKDVGDLRLRQAQNALVLKKYDEAMTLGKDAMRLKAGFGLCFKYYMCGAAAHSAAVVSVAAEKSGNSGTAESYAKKSVAYAKNSGQCEGTKDDSEKNDMCALLYYLSVSSKLRDADTSGTYKEDETCKLVAGTGNIKNLDILYMGHGFTNLSKFDNYVRNSASALLGFRPFDSARGKINIWELNQRTNFDCVTQEPRMFSCDMAKAGQKRVQCPNDQIIIVVDSNEWRGFGGVGLDYSGTSSWKDMPYSVVLHEFGHAFGGLDDEYVYGAGDGYAPNPNSLNCDSTANCPKFAAANVNECHAGCSFNSYYRSIDNGMMKQLGQPFGTFDEQIIAAKLERYGK